MTYTLYVYEHCPYCVKARMIFGIKQVPFELEYILNDDAESPTRMIGQKMVPILALPDGSYMPESIDIIAHIDKLDRNPVIKNYHSTDPAITQWYQNAKKTIFSLAMPRWVHASPALPEFATQAAIAYFTEKKEAYLGSSFAECLKRSPLLIEEMNDHLQALAPFIESENGIHGHLTIDDFHLYAALHSLSIVDGLVYPPIVEAYRRRMEAQSGVPLLTRYKVMVKAA
jgi:glutaredoxin 2